MGAEIAGREDLFRLRAFQPHKRPYVVIVLARLLFDVPLLVVRSARGVLLKGYGAQEVTAEMWPVAVFAVGTAFVALCVFRRQLR